jgi:hypothetical protein
MTIDKDLLRKQLKDAQERRSTGYVAYVKEDTTLRILPFTDAETGKQLVGREFRQWRPKEGRPVPHRGNWGKPDLFDAVRDSSPDFAWREAKAYLVNGVEVGGSGDVELRVWQLPASVYEAILEILLDDEFENVLDLKAGLPFKIKRTGAGLKTKYSVMVGQKAVDVSKFAKGVKDPISAVEDPGLERQGDALGVDPAEFELEEPTPAPVAKKPAKAAEPEEDEDAEEIFAPAAKPKTNATSIRDLLKGGKK